MPLSPRLALLVPALLALGACADNDLNFDSGTVGQKIARSVCPAVAVPTYTGDVTLFDPPASRDARAIDVTATLTDLRPTCTADTAATASIDTNVTFRVDARRENVRGARDVTLPYFATVMRGGNVVVSKQVAQVTLHFADGQARASANGVAYGSITRAAATLPADVQTKITRRRKPQDADASIDPLADPAVRTAVARATFELLVGFQLTDQQLAYNATR